MKHCLHFLGKCGLLLLVSLCNHLPSFSQSESASSWELGFSMGPTNFLGDLGGNQGVGRKFIKDNNFPMTKFMFGAYLAYQPNEWLGFRLAVNQGSLEGDDAIIKAKGGDEVSRKIRNSDFKSPLTEAMLLVEVYPTVFIESDPSDVWLKLRPYVTFGAGLFHFNPKGKDPVTGDWVDLKPLHTEGEGLPQYPGRKEYKLTQVNLPMGIGAKYFLSESVNVGLEILHRTTFTDYIDDVSTSYVDPSVFYANLPLAQAQLAERMANKSGGAYTPGMKRGTATNNDAYFSVNVKLGIRLGSGNRYTNATRCPVHF